MLWNHWWELVCELRSACARTRTFLWMAVCLAGLTIRKDLMGVTSIVRALGLQPICYDRLLDFFHSPALNLDRLTRAWCRLVFRVHPGILRVNARPVLVGDGIKVPKAGRKMPAVKKLHQPSESNTKPEYIFGHSCQAVALVTQALSSVFALPLACRIHEGVVFSNRDQRTLLDKMILLLESLDLKEPFYFVADAYYATGKIARGLLAQGNHLVTRVKSNSVAWYPATPPPPNQPKPQGRAKKYGRKIKVASLLKNAEKLQEAPSPVYGEENVTIRFRVADLLWRPVGILIRFVAVDHPSRGKILLMSTDLDLAPLDITSAEATKVSLHGNRRVIYQLPRVIALIRQTIQDAIQRGCIQGRCAAQDEQRQAGRIAHDRILIVFSEVDDPVPPGNGDVRETHGQFGVGRRIVNACGAVDGADRAAVGA